MNNKNISILLILLILVADQILKYYIKTNFMLGEEAVVAKNWFIIHFVENNGMAFGFEFGKNIGKYFLTIFRIAAIGALAWYLTKLWERKVSMGLIVCFSLILAGATGNLIDSAFYGMIFNDSHGVVASLFPAEGGYSSFLLGKVVDMFYFPLIEGHFPSWFPFWAGQEFIFFRPVFNIADASISIGIVSIFIFHRQHFDEKPEEIATTEEVVLAEKEATDNEGFEVVTEEKKNITEAN